MRGTDEPQNGETVKNERGKKMYKYRKETVWAVKKHKKTTVWATRKVVTLEPDYLKNRVEIKELSELVKAILDECEE